LAQAVLKADPRSDAATKLLQDALSGQRAEAHFRAAESALRRKDFPLAKAEATAGRSAAPWDARGPQLIDRIQRGADRARKEEQDFLINDLLAKARTRAQEQDCRGAIELYNQVLALDASNAHAITGRNSCVPRLLNPTPNPEQVKTFKAGKTRASCAPPV